MRYRHTDRKHDKETDNRIMGTTTYPEVIPKNSDVIYYTKFNDSYMKLAYKYYKDQSLWWIIARANPPYKGSTRFVAGTKVIIPVEISDYLNEFSRINNIRDVKDPE